MEWESDSPNVHVFVLWGLAVLLTLFQLSNGGRRGQRLHPCQRRGLDSLTHRLLLRLAYKTDRERNAVIHQKRIPCCTELIHHEHNFLHIPASQWLTVMKGYEGGGRVGQQNSIFKITIFIWPFKLIYILSTFKNDYLLPINLITFLINQLMHHSLKHKVTSSLSNQQSKLKYSI